MRMFLMAIMLVAGLTGSAQAQKSKIDPSTCKPVTQAEIDAASKSDGSIEVLKLLSAVQKRPLLCGRCKESAESKTDFVICRMGCPEGVTC